MVEFGSHAIPVKKSYVAPLAEKGAIFLDGEVGGTPGMVAARKGVIYLSGDQKACDTLMPITKAFAEVTLYLGPFGSSTTVKVINNIMVGLHIAGTAQAMAIGLRAGVDNDLMIKAIANGSGGSTQFGIRAPWMAERKFMPQQGSAPGLAHYLERGKELGRRSRRRDAAARLPDRHLPSRAAADRRARRRLDHRSLRTRNKTQRPRPLRWSDAMISVRKIAHACYEVPDLDKQVEYYTDILGLTLSAKDKGRGLPGEHGRSPLGRPAERRAARSARIRLSDRAG